MHRINDHNLASDGEAKLYGRIYPTPSIAGCGVKLQLYRKWRGGFAAGIEGVVMHRIGNLTIFFLIAGAGLIQATALDYIGILGVKPDLLLAIVVFFCLSCSRAEAIKTTIAAGLIMDITSHSILGGHTLSFLLMALFLNYHQRKFYKEKSSTQIFVTFFGYFFVSLSVLLLHSIANKTSIPHYPFLNIAFKGAVYTGLISPLVFFMLSKVLRLPLASSL